MDKALNKILGTLYNEEDKNSKRPSPQDIEKMKKFREVYISTFNKVQKRFMEGKLSFYDIQMEFGRFQKETYTDF